MFSVATSAKTCFRSLVNIGTSLLTDYVNRRLKLSLKLTETNQCRLTCQNDSCVFLFAQERAASLADRSITGLTGGDM